MDDADRALARHAARPAQPPLSHFCLVCGDEIPLARRQAAREARHCIDCAASIAGRRA